MTAPTGMVMIAAPAPGLGLAAAMIRILPKPLGGSATAANCPPRLHRIDKETPSARSFAIRVRNVGNGAVDGSSSKHARARRGAFT